MPKASEHKGSRLTKMLIMGDSGTGKTGALLSLLIAGYKIRVIDMDSGLDYLIRQLKKESVKLNKPELLDNLEYVSLRDKRKMGVGAQGVVSAKAVPDAYVKAVGLMDKWEDGTKPAEWGSEYILVLDSFTLFADAAYFWLEALNPTVKDPRQIYGAAQDAVEQVLALLTDDGFDTNVIVISHITYVERQDGTTKGYPSAVGKALSPKIPTYFNSIALSDSSLSQGEVKRTIKTFPTAMIDAVKNPAGTDMPKALPIETGLADFFKKVQE